MKICSVCGSEMYKVERVFPSSSANRTNIYDGSVDIYGGSVPVIEAWRILSAQVEEVYWKCPNCGNYESEKVNRKAGSM